MTEDALRLPRMKKPMRADIMINGQPQRKILYTGGALGLVVNRTPQAIRLWEATGILPETPYKNERHHRYYTEEMIKVVKRSVADQPRAGKGGGVLKNKEMIRQRIIEGWRRLGIPVEN